MSAAHWRAGLVAAFLVLAIVLGTAGSASAHANLVSAQPPAGASVPQAPGAVVLRFSEPLNDTLSTIDVTGPAKTSTAGATQPVPGDPAGIRRPLGFLRPGAYTVRWTSVSSDDGHREEGEYTFAVGVAGSNTTALARAGSIATQGPLGTLGSFIGLVGIALWVGLVVLDGAARRGGVPRRRFDVLARAAPALAFVGSLLAALSVVDVSSASRSMSALTAGRIGVLRVVVLGAATAGVVVHRRRYRYGAFAGIALVAQVAAGHVTATRSPLGATGVLVVHLAAVAVWVAAIVLALMSARVVTTLRVFSPYAVVAAVAVVATGILSAAFELGTPAELFTSGYGIVLLAKAGAVLAVAAFGGWQWRARRAGQAGPRRMGRLLRLEATSAGVALLLGTVLVGSAPPTSGRPSLVSGAAAESLAAPNAVRAAGWSGPFVVGFTITPARPGPVHAIVQVLGGKGAEPVRRVTLSGSGPDGAAFAVRLRSARVDRFEGSARIVRAGSWTLDAALDTDHGIVHVQTTTPLPAPSGSAELDRAIQAQERLVSVRVAETLRSSQASLALDTVYDFHAPDTFTFSTGGSDEIDIGTRSYRRDAGSPRWSVSDTGFPFRWPAPYFEQLWGPGVAPRIVGSDVVDGVESHVVAFARPDLPAWFRIWVGDADGLVRREEMLAENHLMVHTYSDFDRVAPLAAPG